MDITRHIGFVQASNAALVAARSANPTLASSPLVILRGATVIESCERAQALGLKVGDSLNPAVGLYPSVRSAIEADIDMSAVSTLIYDACTELSPKVETLNSRSCFLDVSSSADPRPIAEKLISRLSGGGIESKIAIAQSKLVARLACTQSSKGNVLLLTGTEGASFLRNVPISALWTLPKEVLELANSLHLTTVRDVADIPIALLYEQFGKHARMLLDACNDSGTQSVMANYPPPSIECSLTVSEASLGNDKLEAAVSTLVERAALQLSNSSQVCKSALLEVTFSGYSTRPTERYLIRFPSYTRSSAKLRQKLVSCVAHITAPISRFYLRLSDLASEAACQLNLYKEAGFVSPFLLRDTVDALSSRYGAQSISVGFGEQPSRREQLLRHFTQRVAR